MNISESIQTLATDWQGFKTSHTAELAKLRADLDRISTKAGRSIIGGESAGLSVTPERKAFEAFLKSGDPRELKAVSIGTAADGGYALPKQIHDELLRVEKNTSVLRQLARVESARSGDFNVVIATNSAAAAWSSESGTRTESSTPTFANIAPFFGELYAAPRVSNWAIDDLPSITQWLLEEVGQQFAVSEDIAFLTGSGTNQPKGFLSYTTAATADASRAFGTIEHVATGSAGAWPSGIYDLLVTVAYKLKSEYRQNASWIMPAAAVDTLRKVKDTTGNPIWTPGMGATPATLLGFPVYESEHMPAIAANSLSIAFGDFRKAYLVADRTESSLIVDPYSTKGQTTFYVARRVGGALLDSNAVKVVKFAAA